MIANEESDRQIPSIIISVEHIPQQSQSKKRLAPTAAQHRKTQATVSLFLHQACFLQRFALDSRPTRAKSSPIVVAFYTQNE